MTPERNAQLDEILLDIAESISTMSFATRTKVGAVLYKNNNIISMGWNGMPSGFPNGDVELINPDGTKTTNPLVLHAESNAILKCAAHQGGAEGCTLYVTLNPCLECAKLIIQAGIKRVVYRTNYRILDAIDILESAGIEIVKLEKKSYDLMKEDLWYNARMGNE